MKGPKRYSFRIKTLGFAKAIKHNPHDDYLYMDGDTFRASSIVAAKESIEKGRLGLYENSGKMINASDSRNQKLYKLLKGKSITGYTIDENTCRQNAGIITVPNRYGNDVIQRILEATDELHTLTGGYWASEELACNFALQSLGPVDDISEGIGHYFGNKGQWTAMITNFFARHALMHSSLDDMIADAAAFDFTSIPVFLHTPKRRKQLHRLAERFWPMTRPRYFPAKVKSWDEREK